MPDRKTDPTAWAITRLSLVNYHHGASVGYQSSGEFNAASRHRIIAADTARKTLEEIKRNDHDFFDAIECRFCDEALHAVTSQLTNLLGILTKL